MTTISRAQRLDGVRTLWPLYSIPRIAQTLGLSITDVNREIDALAHREHYFRTLAARRQEAIT